jgi:single-stranded DNA-binding protein
MRGIEAATWGSATRDGETRESKAGNSFGIVNIAVNEGKTDDAGKEVSTYVKVLLFGSLASEAARITKGDRCYVEGQLSAGIWQHESGPRIDLTVKAFRFERTQIGKQRPRRGTSDSDTPITASNFASAPRAKPQIQGRDRFDFDDEIPFGR